MLIFIDISHSFQLLCLINNYRVFQIYLLNLIYCLFLIKLCEMFFSLHSTMPAILLANSEILIEVCSYIYLEMSFVYLFENLIIRLSPLAFSKVCRIF